MEHEDKLRHEVGKIMDELQRLRDEVRVKLHLGAMDARERFVDLEREIDQTGRQLGRQVSEATRSSLEEALLRLKSLAAAFRDRTQTGSDAHR